MIPEVYGSDVGISVPISGSIDMTKIYNKPSPLVCIYLFGLLNTNGQFTREDTW